MCFSLVMNPQIGYPPNTPDGQEGGNNGPDDYDYLPENSCIKKPLVVFMGGFGDIRTRAMFEVAEEYRNANFSKQDVYYREYTSGAQVIKLVEKYHAAGQKVAVIGHSWGGDSAFYNVAKKTSAKIDILATLDPVGRNPGKPMIKPNNVVHYINVYINQKLSENTGANRTARLGGPWESVSCADEDYDYISLLKKHKPDSTNIPDHSSCKGMFRSFVKKKVEVLQ